ncbi:MAG: autotransporter domain-containing protein [Proteobacteria bacterium]|nr:autotransporter domain-containing protein [Pseudomonadota bacterium]
MALLVGSAGHGLYVSPATAAEQVDNVDNDSTTALTGGNSAKFTAPAAGTDEVFTVGNGINVGDTGVVVSATTADGIGSLTYLGDSTATGTIGDTANRLGILNAGVAGKTVTITGNVFAITTNVTGTGTLNFQGNLTGNLDYDADGTATVATGVNLTGTVTTSAGDDTGTLTLFGTTTVSGQVGTAPASLKVVNGGANGTTAIFSADVFAQTLNVTGTGTVDLDGAFTGVLDFDADGTATIATTKNLTGTVTTSAGDNTGTLTLEGTTTVSGQVGTAPASLKVVNGGANGTTAAFSADVFAQTLNVTGTGTVDLDGNFTGTLDFDADGTATVATGKTVATVTNSSGAAAGTLTFEGTTTTGGTIGSILTAVQQLKDVNFNGGTASVGHDIGATTIDIAGGATVNYSASKAYDGDLTNAGTLDLSTYTLTGSGNGAGTGKFTLSANATLKTTISSVSAAGNISTVGNVNVSGTGTTLDITVNTADYIASGTTYTIVNGGGGTDTGVNAPATITDNSSILSFSAITTGNDLIITTARNVVYVSTAGSGVGAGAAAALESISDSGATGDMATVLGALDGLSGSTQATAIATTTPEVSGGATVASFTAQGQTLGTVSARLGDLRAGLDDDEMTGFATGNRAKGVGIWLRGFGNRSEQRKRAGVDGYRADTFGVAVGGDKRLLEDRLTLGLAYAYAGSEVDSTGGRDGNGTDVASHQGTAYGSYGTGRWYVEGMANVAYNNYDSVRKVTVGSIQRTAKGDYKGWQYGAKAGGGYNIDAGKAVITLTASLQYSRLDLDGYTETGADSLNLNVDDRSFDRLRSSLGARMAYSVETGVGTFVPEVHAAWLYDLVADKQEVTSTYTGGGGAFNTEGADPARHGANVGASVALHATSNVTLSANYDAEFKDRYASHSGTLTVGYHF